MDQARAKILTLKISRITREELIDGLSSGYSKPRRKYACFANVHMCIETLRSNEVRESVNGADYVLPDGYPLVLALRLMYGIRQERIPGMDMMPAILARAQQDSVPVFFYGSSETVLSKLAEKVGKDFPFVKIAGLISPPYRALTDSEIAMHREKINLSGAGYVFVGLGCPKQEIWMAENSPYINAILLGVGGAFEVYAGIRRRAPLWMQKIGMEWFFRFIQEPQRLWKRYLTSNLLFIILIVFAILKSRIVGHKINLKI
ncbi:MAG TPA: WecB/TagA/CpsF family glycosyltransferase [Cyclobacteriaceae bacterium]|nr:WecB/TagA/CpsF family glycosyltransferase [Cyclobacteriaceae bacterium]